MPTILPDPAHLHLDHIPLVVAGKENRAPCPLRGYRADRVHSHSVPTLADLPWNGVAVRLHLTVRRFLCETEDCPRRIFAERFSALAAPYARRTNRLADILELVSFALGGEAGAQVLAEEVMRLHLIERLTHTGNTPCTCLLESAGEPVLRRRIHRPTREERRKI